SVLVVASLDTNFCEVAFVHRSLRDFGGDILRVGNAGRVAREEPEAALLVRADLARLIVTQLYGEDTVGVMLGTGVVKGGGLFGERDLSKREGRSE
ncbi:hypothetical protein, partial [Mesorhizobium carmichaelinearum]|uniref:hypothetical protein n=1 Tax=Mesorhizobium carmichaelinearum TaxID=1208188 RepID=UPI001AECCCEA